MKKVFFGILFLIVGMLYSQGELTSASALVMVKKDTTFVQQNLHLNLPDSLRQVTVKMLEFEGNKLLKVSAIIKGRKIPIKKDEGNGLITIPIELPIQESSADLELKYTVETKTLDRYVPFFFTELAATNSDNDFFTIKLQSAPDVNYTLLFPNVETIKKDLDDIKQIEFQIPALTSMLRLEMHEGQKTDIALATWMDGLVALIFLIMGFVIWMNRKRLAYG